MTPNTPTEPQQLLAGGKIASSISPAFHLIPSVAITALANRCKLGVERKADKAWNATTNNQECLTDRELIMHRIGHVIDHALKLRDKLIHADAENDIEALNTDDDAAAVMWGGMFLVCAIDAVRDEMEGIDAKARAVTQDKPYAVVFIDGQWKIWRALNRRYAPFVTKEKAL